MPRSTVNIMLSLSLTAMLAGALLTGCADKEGAAGPGPGQTGMEQNAPGQANNVGGSKNSSGNGAAAESGSERKQILEQFERLQTGDPEAKDYWVFFDEHLAALPQDDAGLLMQKLLAFYEEDLLKTQDKFAEEPVTQALSELGWPIPDEQLKQIKDDAVRQTVLGALAGGYKLETAEGMVFPVVNYGALKKYSSALSEKMQDFIALLAMDSDAKMASDGGLVITWDELAERAVAAEKYFTQYAGTPEAQQAKKLFYTRYLTTYLYGLDNTPIFDFDTFKLTDEVKASYEHTVKTYPGTKTAAAVQGFLDVLKNADWQVFTKENGKQTDVPAVKQYRDRVLAGNAD
ncbi:hypothetical protein [Paenibacillus sp. TH7-28]